MVTAELTRRIRGMLTDNAEFEAKQIVMKTLSLTHTELILKSDNEVSGEDVKAALEAAERRINGEPLQYILGETEFMSLPFKLSRSVLIPRSDTETLVEYVLKLLKEKNWISKKNTEILDIGAGSGCVGISLAYYVKNARVTELDISSEALETARENAELNGVAGRMSFIRADILTQIPDGQYDIVVSNPPYIETEVIPTLQTEVKNYEPLSALDGGEDGLAFYRRITRIAPKLIKSGGLLAFEIGYNQGAAVKELMDAAGFEKTEIIKDLCGCNRAAVGIFAR